ncbi:MAG: LptF/LptG family permease, partial [Clostridia bacterium]|nr:LptF/LptG family permease [Clostridia bacterium]
RSRAANGELLGILVHDAREPEVSVTLMAERGALVHGEAGPRVVMINGSRQEVIKGSGKMSLLYFDSYTMDIATGSGPEGPRFREAAERSMDELLGLKVGAEPSLTPVTVRRFRVEAHQRLTNPLLHISFSLIALAALLSGPFDRRGSGKRLGGAVACMIAVQAGAIGAANLAAKSLAVLPALYTVVLLPGLLALLLLARPRLLMRRPARGRAS